jgi:hypothetical protein
MPDSRPGSTSTGRRVPMSIRMVLYDWPRRTAKSSIYLALTFQIAMFRW